MLFSRKKVFMVFCFFCGVILSKLGSLGCTRKTVKNRLQHIWQVDAVSVLFSSCSCKYFLWGFGRCDVKWGPEQLLHSGHLPEQQMVWNLSRGHKSVHYILSEDFSHKSSCLCPENTKEKAVVFHTVVHVGDKRTLVFWPQTSLSPH